MPQATDGSRWDPSKLEKAAAITCPVLNTLYMNGDLDCTEDGLATKEQLMDALKRTGLRSDFLADALSGAANDGPINVFKMDGGMKFEHSVSTGARDPSFNEAKFNQMASFANPEGRLYATEWKRLLSYFTKHPNDTNKTPNLPGKGTDMMAVSAGMLVAFGRDEKGDGKSLFLTVEDLRGMYELGKYPVGWALRKWGVVDMLGGVRRLLFAGCCGCSSKAAPDVAVPTAVEPEVAKVDRSLVLNRDGTREIVL